MLFEKRAIVHLRKVSTLVETCRHESKLFAIFISAFQRTTSYYYAVDCLKQGLRSKPPMLLLQHEAARIVTGLRRSVSLGNLFKECGWETLTSRRKNSKLCFMYKVSNNIVPHYIKELIPPLVGNRSRYQLRNSQNYENVRTRTSLLQNSCIPSSISLWNNLEQEIRSCTTYCSFKSKLRIHSRPARVISLYYYMNNCSNLNGDRFQNHLKPDPTCDCGKGTENAGHYFFKCSRYTDIRNSLFQAARVFHPLDTTKRFSAVQT